MKQDHRIQLGRAGERTAEKILTEEGLEIIERNWRHRRLGELDLIAHDTNHYVAIEVRTRVGNTHGSSLESIDAKKLRTLRLLACEWGRQCAMYSPIRVDVLALTLPQDTSCQIRAGVIPDDLRTIGAQHQWIRAIA